MVSSEKFYTNRMVSNLDKLYMLTLYFDFDTLCSLCFCQVVRKQRKKQLGEDSFTKTK